MSTRTLTTTTPATTRTAETRPLNARTRAMLTCGAAAGPPFVLLILAQEATRDGFDPTRHPLSMLSLGDQG